MNTGLEERGIVVRSLQFLRGPNLYAYKPLVHIILAIGPYEELGSDEFPGFVERLTAWLPGLEEHGCTTGEPGGFVERLRRGTYLAHIAEHITLELQGLMGFAVNYGRARGTGERGVYRVLFAYREEEPAVEAFVTGLRLALAAMHNEPFDVEAEVERLRTMADEHRLGPSTAAVVEAARARKIPALRLTPKASLVQLGFGVHQKRIRAAETALTSSIAVEICQDKLLTNQMLRTVGVPVPEGSIVGSEDEAWEVAQALGLPVVIKPADGNQGKGVHVRLTTEDEVREAYRSADSYSRQVMVEKFAAGQDYRLLIVGGRMVAAARREPPAVVGDGERTVLELVAELNRDPRRRKGHGGVLSRVEPNSAVELALQQQGLALDSVPEADQTVRLRQNSNLSTGGTATDVTDEVHPYNVRMAELAAQILALDIAGVDVVCNDISRPMDGQGGVIVEVNAAPGLRMHLYPTAGQARDVAAPIVESLYPNGSPARIPIVGVTGTNGKTTVTRLIAHIFQTAHRVVGMTCTDGTYIDGSLILKGDCSGPRSARAVLLHPHVQVAVLETARGGILREGLAFDRCSTAVVTNVSADHLDEEFDTPEKMARVKEVLVESVADDGAAVLNAQDPLVAEMAASCAGRVVYFSAQPDHPVLRSHLAGGGEAVTVENGEIVLVQGAERVPLVHLDRVPFLLGGRLAFQVMNALAAVAAAWAEGVNPALIVRALTTFATDSRTVPGRFNLLEAEGVQIIVDYGHNPAALHALGEAAAALGPRPTTVAFTLPGDRRDQDLVDSTRALLPFVDRWVLYDSEDLRGRAAGEMPKLAAGALPPGTDVQCVSDQRSAVEQAWRQVGPGERLILIADEVEPAFEMLREVIGLSDEDMTCEVTLPNGRPAAEAEQTVQLA